MKNILDPLGTCVRHAMSPPPLVMFPHVPVLAALGYMELRRSPYLVVMARRKVVGMVSKNHLQVADGAATVAQVMRRDTPVVDAGDTVERAAAIMLTAGLSWVPVTDGSRLVGTLTTADVLRAMCTSARAGATPAAAALPA
jgi:CBS domain-containing protein